ncbi:DUF2934 domain-containing protein [Pseudothauera lacus]|uniref:DUF2934 domain-containing protein n=1 Tax=Pseudothauera lacus TaxID=2136175 RepID=A0A2T4IF06_9RHOO|nr:DUF2934 domain-containing protein [Pseudothauera lacus]PTD96370.1 DUF2934 domain-containing protein [Pseudothauera lacus]
MVSKSAAAKPSAPPAAPAAKPRARKRSNAAAGTLNAEQRSHYVEVAAYYIAERRNFTPGDPMADWLEAEAEIDRLLSSGHFGTAH